MQDEVYIIIPSTGFKLGLSLSSKILLRLGTERLIHIYLATTVSVHFIRQYIRLFMMQVITRVPHAVRGAVYIYRTTSIPQLKCFP